MKELMLMAWLDCVPIGLRFQMLTFCSEIEVLTYVSRGFGEYRGFPQAMQTIALLQSHHPNLHVLIVGRIWSHTGRDDLISVLGEMGSCRSVVGLGTNPLDRPPAN